MKYQWRVYLHGLIASVLNGVSNSVIVVMVDPMKFNLADGAGIRNLGIVMGASAVFAFFTYLKEHPLPDPEKDTDFRVAKGVMVDKAISAGTWNGRNE